MPTRPPKAYPNGQRPTPREPRPRERRPYPHQHLYDSVEWKRLRKAFRAEHPRCQCEYHAGKPDAPKSECVDHIVAHRGNRALFFDRSNLRAIVDELLPKVRRLNPTMPDDQVLELAESMAELRLLDEEIG
jgi:5-methylcytosine-specific restriction enzyme A